MIFLKKFTCAFVLILSVVSATEFTICSYNCGGLTEHYDYLRAVTMQKLMQERYTAEPENMSLNEKIQVLALKILFETDPVKQVKAQQEWDQNGYQQKLESLTAAPSDANSLNRPWNKKAEEMITSYKVRPVAISDTDVIQILDEHLNDLTNNKDSVPSLLNVRSTMAKRIFAHHLKFDIICLQETTYIDSSQFPENYEVQFSNSSHSQNGVAWNKDRFELIESIGNIMDKAYVVKLMEKETGKKILVASGHISGCNPYQAVIDPNTGVPDSAKGDTELKTVIQLFNNDIDLMIIGMDSNVTSLHPRLNILKDAGFQLDFENFLEPTCTNPYQVLNTRIDWIAFKANSSIQARIENIPVLSVNLNNLQTNVSDHKPIATKITY